MIDFPSSTEVRKRIPKEAFYKKVKFTTSQKNHFVSDVEKIVVENSLTKESLNLTADSDIKEIILLSMSLKKQEYDSGVVEEIARQNPHKLVFLLIFGEKRQLAVYHSRLYRTQWLAERELDLKLRGLTLDDMWESFVERVALHDERAVGTGSLSLDERLALQERILRLEKSIKTTDAAVWRERQPHKSFALHTKLREYKKELEELKSGSHGRNKI